MKVGSSTVGSGNLSTTSDVTVSATNTTTSGTVLTVTVTNISKGIKVYQVSYTYESSTPTHTLTYSATNGSISGVDAGSNAVASGASVAEGATVTLTATPSTGYKFTSWNVSGTGSSLTSETTNPTTFTMGTANATVTANFEVDNTVATPTFDPDGSDTYTQAQNVTISCATGGATIHYTTNGNDPTESDAVYSSAVSITTSKTVLKAKAFKDGMTASAVASATYTIKPSKPTVTAAGAMVTITGNDGLEFYYTTDGTTTPTKSSTKYTGPFNPGADCTIKARAFDSYSNGSDVSSFTYKYFPLLPKDINSGYYVKVTDVDDLENGDAILIVNETNNVALSTTQNDNNRGEEGVTISSNVIKNPSNKTQKLVIVKTNESIGNPATSTDVFYFYTGSGYLYAASSSKNYLKTETTPSNNARATISISSGNATITFTGNNTRNLIQYNSSSSIFSCYGSSQAAVQIYKEVPAEPSDPTTSGEETYLTTSDNMAGWRAFYSESQGYTLDTKTKAYVATAKSGTDAVTLTTIDAVPAGTPVILKTTDENREMTLTKGTPAAYTGTNYLKVTTGGEAIDAYRLGYNSTDGVAFYPYAVASAPAGVIYLELPAGARVLEMNLEDGEVTAIETVKAEKANNEYYNLAGQRVANPTKGLYIVNGRKVVVK